MQGIYNYILETNQVYTVNSVAAILWSQFMAQARLYPMLNALHSYISTYMYAYIYKNTPCVHQCFIKTVACGTSHKYTNIRNVYSLKYYKHFTQQYYKSSFYVFSAHVAVCCIFLMSRFSDVWLR
jgi:hypothetical protein